MMQCWNAQTESFASVQAGCAKLSSVVYVQVCRALLATSHSLCHVDYDAVHAQAAAKGSRKDLGQHQGAVAQAAGRNFRVLPVTGVCLACAFVSPLDIVLVSHAFGGSSNG